MTGWGLGYFRINADGHVLVLGETGTVNLTDQKIVGLTSTFAAVEAQPCGVAPASSSPASPWRL